MPNVNDVKGMDLSNSVPTIESNVPIVDLADSVKAFRQMRRDEKHVRRAGKEFFDLFVNKAKFAQVFEQLMEVAFCKGYDAGRYSVMKKRRRGKCGDLI